MDPHEYRYKPERAPVVRETPVKQFVPKDMTGTLFSRQNPEGSTRPDMTGDLNVGGKVYQVGAWTTLSANGQRRISIRLTEPYTRGSSEP